MRSLIIGFAIFSVTAQLAFGSSNLAKAFPESLDCTADSTNPVLKDGFSVQELRGKPWLDGSERGPSLDARSENAVDVDFFLTTFNASNQCDNNYELAFPTEDLVALKKGKLKEVKGIMKFANSESPCAESGCELSETAIITCR